MAFITIFSIESDGFRFALEPLEALFIVPVLIAGGFIARRLAPDDTRVKAGSIFALGLSGLVAFMSIISSVGMARSHRQLLRQFNEGRFLVAEGPISRLSEGRHKGRKHPHITFEVAGKRFELSDIVSEPTLTYSRFRRSGLAENHDVRIFHSGATIMRLDVRQP
jgi:hypothetical protein